MQAPEWRWENPVPQSNRLAALWASSALDLHAVGEGGVVLHSTDGGDTWQVSWLDDKTDLSGLWGAAPGELTASATRTYGSSGALLHSTDAGKSWSQVLTEHPMYALWGSSPQSIYAVGAASSIMHSKDRGVSWTAEPAPKGDDFLSSVWGVSSREVVAVGHLTQGTLLGTTDGRNWQASFKPRDYVNATWGTKDVGVYAVGSEGLILHSADGGRRWQERASDSKDSFIAVAGSLQKVCIASSANLFCRPHAAKSWTRMSLEPTPSELGGLAASQAGMFAFGTQGFLARSRDDGGTWTALRKGSVQALRALWGQGDVLFAAGWNGAVLKREPASQRWRALQSGSARPLNALWGSSANDVYAVGDFGTVLHTSDGGAHWEVRELSSNHLTGVWGSSALDVYMVGDSGTILHSANGGKTWEPRQSGVEQHLTAIWGRSADDITIVGSGGAVIHSQDRGITWQVQQSGSEQWLTSVWGRGASEVFAAGYAGTLIHSVDRGAAWTAFTTEGREVLRGICGNARGEVYVGGNFGVVHHSSGDTTSWKREQSPSQANLSACLADGETLYVAGDNGTILHRGR